MKTKLSSCLTLLAVLMMQFAFAQNQNTITGTVTDENGVPLPGVNITVDDATTGTVTNFNGEFTIEASQGQVLHFNAIGFKDKAVTVGTSNTMEVVMQEGTLLDQVVVTALGISREKRSLGYSTQQVSGDKLSATQPTNFVNALSGRVAGLNIRRNNNFGGSTNIVIRGYSSLKGNNQPLFVVDGVPISNNTANTAASMGGAGTSYDYGNAAMDIDPSNIASVNVLKGAAATALYGSRAANGVIIITTKKGHKGTGLGVTISSGVEVGVMNPNTFVEYQQYYGAGYAPGFNTSFDIDGDGVNDQLPLFKADASYGPKYDPNLMIYQWDAFDPASPNYLKKTPWVAPENGPEEFFQTAVVLTNNVAISNGTENGAYRFAYSKKDATGIMPNSHMHRNDFRMSANFDVTDKLHVSGFANYVKTRTKGRNITGYGANIMTSFRQWNQTNVDVLKLKRLYEKSGRNITWNPKTPFPGSAPMFWDNPYFARFENYQNDMRSRFIGKLQFSYDITDWWSVVGKISTDTYNTIQEERRAVGSHSENFGVTRSSTKSGYLKRNISFYETNYNVRMNFNKDITEDLDFNGILGMNIRRSGRNYLAQSTAGGLLIPDLYALSNGKLKNPKPIESVAKRGVNGFFANASFGYDDMLYLDASIRRDHSSTLPEENSVYWYPSVSASWVFTEMLDSDVIDFGKLRAGYAEVGSDAPFDRIMDTYVIRNDIGTSLPATHNNPNLKPERTKSFDVGLEMNFFDHRLGLVADYYHMMTVNQILATSISAASGYDAMLVNAGKVRNSGVELALTGTPIQTEDFTWNINVNWSTNNNMVVELPEGIKTITLGSYQGHVSFEATEGMPYGVIKGSDFIYKNGQKLITTETDPSETAYGMYQVTSSVTEVLGQMTPDWRMGISNTFSYKNLSLSFLIDMQQGGEVFSLDMWYGTATGLYPETAFVKENGVNIRAPKSQGGGYIFPGVLPNGQPNDRVANTHEFGYFGYASMPNAAYVYDASYIKLRQVALTYALPQELLENTFLNSVAFSLTGSNLWIIEKHVPYADPESGLGAGNVQGYLSGAMPSTRRYGFNVTLKF